MGGLKKKTVYKIYVIFSGGSDDKGSTYNAGDPGLFSGFNLWVRKILWRTEWLPTPVFFFFF